MSQIIPFLFQGSSTPNYTNWETVTNNVTFNSLPVPEFECVDFLETTVLDWDTLQIQHDKNRARAGGVDTLNISGLTSELRSGYRVTENPPIVVILPNGKKELWDGYNRAAASYDLGIKDFVFNVYKLKDSWAEDAEDAYDIVSLGANNHTIAKRHTINDFVLRGVAYCNRRGNKLSKDEINTWVSGIDHCFNQKQVSDIVDKIYQQTTISVNIAPFVHPKNAQAKVTEIIDTGSSTNPVIICCKEQTYIERGFLQIMKNVVENDIDTTDVVTYTKGCETAEEVVSQRKFASDYLTKLDALVVKYVTKRLTSNSPAFTIAGALPQLIGVEDPQSLVELS